MTITTYTFPVLYDVGFPEFSRTAKTNQTGIFVIEFEDGHESCVRGYLFNRDCALQGCCPLTLKPVDYDANSWAMFNSVIPRKGLEYNEGSIRVQVKPLRLNSPIGKIIRHDYHDIPLKTIKEF